MLARIDRNYSSDSGMGQRHFFFCLFSVFDGTKKEKKNSGL